MRYLWVKVKQNKITCIIEPEQNFIINVFNIKLNLLNMYWKKHVFIHPVIYLSFHSSVKSLSIHPFSPPVSWQLSNNWTLLNSTLNEQHSISSSNNVVNSRNPLFIVIVLITQIFAVIQMLSIMTSSNLNDELRSFHFLHTYWYIVNEAKI